MKKLLAFCLTLTTFVLYGQNETIDSLKLALKNYEAKKKELRSAAVDINDTIQVKTYIALGIAYKEISDYTTSKKYADDARVLSEKIHYKRGIGNALSVLGNLNYNLGNYPEALKNNFASLKIREELGDKKNIAGSHNNIGLVYQAQSNYPLALKEYFAALKINEEIDNKNFMAANHNNIGAIYLYLDNYEAALKEFRAALKINEQLNNKMWIATNHNNIGNIYFLQHNYTEALKEFSFARKIREEINDKHGLIAAINNIGNVFSEQGKNADALVKHFAALELSREIGSPANIAISLRNIGTAYVRSHNAKEGQRYLLEAISINKELGDKNELKECYGNLAKADSALGNGITAFEYYKLFVAYRDSMSNEENTKKITQQQMQFDFDKKQTADSLNFAQEKQLAVVKLQKQKTITYGGFAAAAVTLVLLFFAYSNYKKQRIANQKLKEAQEQLIKSEKMAAFGVMASRVSHEIQNPLNFVNNFSEMAEEMVNEMVQAGNEEERKETAKDLITNLQKIKQHGKRADAIVKQLQEHTNKGTAHEYFEKSE